MTRYENRRDAVTPAVIVFIAAYLFTDFVVFRFSTPPISLELQAAISLILAMIISIIFFITTTDVLSG